MKEYQINCSKFCGYVKVDDNNIIVETMPILRKFVGQNIQNLTTWAKRKFNYCTLKEIR